MAKVEVLQIKSKFRVQVTFREPFEHFFEIAVHRACFDHPRDASRLAERIRAKVKEIGLSMSVACILSEDEWNYTSSAYDGRYNHKVDEYNVPASKKALMADMEMA